MCVIATQATLCAIYYPLCIPCNIPCVTGLLVMSSYIVQVILYQSVEDGSIALKADEDGYEDNGCSKDFYSDAEITSGVSFKMRLFPLK